MLRIFFCGLMLSFTAGSAWAQTASGAIKALRITGTVTKVAADGSKQPLAEGAILSENDTVITEAGSGVVLVFMNGSSVKLGASSRLAIEQFKMDPLADNSSIEVAKLTAEPTVSQTTLNLSYGEVVGDVKKLNRSSSYSIKTPAGAAGIRGTVYRIVFTPSPDGRTFSFTLSTAEGVVVFSGTTGAADVLVAEGSQVVVQAEVNPSSGEVSNVQVRSEELPPAARAEIEAAVADVIQQAQAAAVFTPAEQRSENANNQGNQGNNQGNQDDNKDKEKRDETPPPPPETTTPQPIDPSTVSRSG